MPFVAPPPPVPAVSAAATPAPVVALRYARQGDATELLRLRPRTLTTAAPAIRLPPSAPAGHAVAPDGRRVAVATTSGVRERTRVTVVSAAAWKRRSTIRLTPRFGAVQAMEWVRRDRVLVFQRQAAVGNPMRVTVIDPLAGERVGAPRSLGRFGAPRAAGDRVVLFDTTRDRTGNRVLVLDADGRATGRVDAGDLAGPGATRGAEPSWTVDPVTGHALGLASRSPVLVDVDPVAATATRRDLPPVVTPGTRQQWIEGASDAARLAFAVTDGDTTTLVPVDRATLTAGAPVPLTGRNPAAGAGDLVLVPSSALSSSTLKGLRAYDLTGAPRWTAEPGHRTTSARRFGDVLYADVQGVGSTILDARTGATLGRGPRRPLQILERTPQYETEQPWFGFGGD